jgi:hypothetical protein
MKTVANKGENLQLIICACYSWKTELRRSRRIIPQHIRRMTEKRIGEKAGKVNCKKTCVMNDEASRCIPTGCYASSF